MAVEDYIRQIEDLSKTIAQFPKISEEQEDALNRKFRLEFNYNSNHIEGNTLTYDDTELLLIFDGTKGSRSHRDYEEMKASDVAFNLVKELALDSERELTESFIKSLNKILLVRPYWKDSEVSDGQVVKREITIGDYKKHPNHVRLKNGEIFTYASPSETPLMMSDLITWFRLEIEKKENFHPVYLAALLHYRFVRIHPFDDGNGRISRLLMNYVLLKFGYPVVVIRSNDKNAYLRALNNADTGNINSFIEYIAKQLVWSMELCLKAAKNEKLDEEADWKKRLDLVKRQFHDKESIQIVHSVESVKDFINNKLFLFIGLVKEELKEFNELFLKRNAYVYTPGRRYNIHEGLKMTDDNQIKNNFYQSMKIIISFEEFTKNVNDPFSIDVEINISFTKYKVVFDVSQNNDLMKLYHQVFSEKDLNFAVNLIGETVVGHIENKLK